MKRRPPISAIEPEDKHKSINERHDAEQGKYRMYNIYDFYALEAVFFISGKCTDEQINKIDCRARAYYAEKSWNEFVPERIEICYPAVCPCRTAQKHCGTDAEHKARVGESAGIYRASDFLKNFISGSLSVLFISIAV